MAEKYTVAELSDILQISEQATRKKVYKVLNEISKDNLKLDMKVSKENINGYPTTVVYCNDNVLSYFKATTKSFKNIDAIQIDKQVENQNLKVSNDNLQPIVNYREDEFLKGLVSELVESKNQLINYAKEVGKVLYLTDNLKNKEEDADHWQNKYFELNYDYKKQGEMVSNLEEENRQLRKYENEVIQLDLKLKSQKEEFESQFEIINNELSEVKQHKTNMTSEIVDLKLVAESKNTEINDLKNKLEESNNNISSLESENNNLKQQLDTNKTNSDNKIVQLEESLSSKDITINALNDSLTKLTKEIEGLKEQLDKKSSFFGMFKK